MGLVGVQGARVAVSQLQRRGCFPAVGEAVDVFELDRAGGGARARRTSRRGRRLAVGGGRRPAPAASVDGRRVRSGGAGRRWPASRPRRRPVCTRRRGATVGRGPSGRDHSWSSLATVSAGMPVSRSRTRAALAVGATPNTSRPCPARSVTAARSIVVLPAPAGPTTTTNRSQPATAAAASACSTSSPSRVTVVEGCGSASLGVEHPGQDRFLLGDHRGAGDLGGDRFDPHRSPIRRHADAPCALAGSRSTQASSTRSTARSTTCAHRCPDTPGCGTQPIGDRPQHVEAMPHRPCRRQLADHIADRHRRRRAQRATLGADRAPQRVRCDADLGGFGQPP